MAFKLLSTVASWLPVVLMAILVGLFIWKKLYRRFPLFFIYLVATEAVAWIRYVASIRFIAGSISQPVFYSVYWISDLVLAICAFLALYELFIGRLFARFYKVRFYRLLFPCAGIAILGFILLAALRAPKPTALSVAVHTFELLRATVLMFFVLLMLVMGREWKRHEFGITLGFGIYASALVAYAAIVMKAHGDSTFANELLRFAYLAACCVWLISFLRSDLTLPELSESLPNPDVLNEAKKWEGVLKGWLSPTKKRQ